MLTQDNYIQKHEGYTSSVNMILSHASEDTDCTDENVLGYIGEVIPQKDIQSLKEQFMAFIQLKNYTQLIIQNSTRPINNYNIILDKN